MEIIHVLERQNIFNTHLHARLHSPFGAQFLAYPFVAGGCLLGFDVLFPCASINMVQVV